MTISMTELHAGSSSSDPKFVMYPVITGETGVVDTLYPYGDVRRYGAKCDWNGTTGTDDKAAILAAFDSAKGAKFWRVFFPALSKLGSGFSLDVSYSGLSLWAIGGNKAGWVKAFDGDMCDLATVVNFEVHNLHFDGQYGTHTGKGFVLSGNCNFPIFDEVDFIGFSDAHIEFGPNSGYYAKVNSQHYTGPGQGDFASIRVAGPDTAATPRRLNVESNGYVDLVGAFDTRINGGFVTAVHTDANCSITKVIGTVWANNGASITLKGVNFLVIGCRISGDVILDTSMAGSFIGNVQTEGTFTDNSVAGNVIVMHHPLSATYRYIDKHRITTFPAMELQATSTNSIGDADVTFTVDAVATTLVFASNLTANRTVTLSTTNARNGSRLRVSRTAGDSGGIWTLTIGGTGTVLRAREWCDVQYNGSFWLVIGMGSFQANEPQFVAQQSVGDADATFTADSTPQSMVFGTNLTANRSLTLSATNARNGTRCHVTRSGGDTGGPWTLAIGATGKTLSAVQWCIVEYNGSFWQVIAKGSLT